MGGGAGGCCTTHLSNLEQEMGKMGASFSQQKKLLFPWPFVEFRGKMRKKLAFS